MNYTATLEELTNNRPDEVVDPTMLWGIDFWDEIANKSTLNKKNYQTNKAWLYKKPI